MRQKYYLIDTENIGDKWIELIEGLQEEEFLVVFYTKNHSRQLEETYLRQRYNQQIQWVECITGSSALDYQLVGVLAYLIAKHSDASYVIYSNDGDYQEVIDFWSQKNVRITGMKVLTEKKNGKENGGAATGHAPADQSHGNPALAHQAVREAKAPEPPRASKAKKPEEDLKPSGILDVDALTDEEKVLEIAKAVPVSNMNGWYVALVALLGQERGRDSYVQIREDKERQQELAGYLLPDARDRNPHLIELLYSHNHLDAVRAREAWKIVQMHSVKNKKAIKADFDKQFGKKTSEQAQYYKVIKPLIPLLKGK